jgi:hypothetical protein
MILPRVWHPVDKAGIIFPNGFRFQSGGATHGNQKESQDHNQEKENLNR